MNIMNILIPSPYFHSFQYVATIVNELYFNNKAKILISKPDNGKNLWINDFVTVFSNKYIRERIDNRDILWLDTPLIYYFDESEIIDSYDKLYVCSRYNYELYRKYFRIDGIIGRPINYKIANKFEWKPFDERIYDFVIINPYADAPKSRKNWWLIKKVLDYMKDRVSYFIITGGVFSDYEKFKIISESKFLLFLSYVEGFGMPPIEAAYLGCIPIVLDVPAVNEFDFVYKIPIKERKILKYNHAIRGAEEDLYDEHVIEISGAGIKKIYVKMPKIVIKPKVIGAKESYIEKAYVDEDEVIRYVENLYNSSITELEKISIDVMRKARRFVEETDNKIKKMIYEEH